MLFFLVGPFAFFSNMSLVSQFNPIDKVELKFGFEIEEKDASLDTSQTYNFFLYSTQSPLSIKPMNE